MPGLVGVTVGRKDVAQYHTKLVHLSNRVSFSKSLELYFGAITSQRRLTSLQLTFPKRGNSQKEHPDQRCQTYSPVWPLKPQYCLK